MGKEKRRFPRYQIALPVLLKDKRTTLEMVTGDISRHGVFLRTDNPKPTRQLVQLTLKLPTGNSVEVMGMVARSVLPEDEAQSGPGMGIDFFALSANAKNIWDSWVFALRTEERKAKKGDTEQADETSDDAGDEPPADMNAELAMPELPPVDDFTETTGVADMFEDIPDGASIPEERDDEVPPPIPPDVLDEVRQERSHRETRLDMPAAPIRRMKPRFVASFLVRLKDKERLKKFYTKDISAGGMFLKTPLLKKAGDDVEVILVHPETDQEFHLGGTVVRVETNGDMTTRGMAIEFHQLAKNKEMALIDFIETGLELLDPEPDPEESKIRTLESAADLAPKSPRVHAALGKKLLEEREDPEGAVKEFEQALALDAEYIPAHRGLQTAYALIGEADKAFHHLREVKRLKKEHPEKDESLDL